MRRAVLSIAICLVASSAFATPYALDADFKLPPPPKSGSAAEKKDYAELHQLQSTRTDEECEIAASQQHMDSYSLFGPPTGILSKAEYATLKPIMDDVLDTVGKESEPFKEEYARKRPYDVDSTIQPCVPRPGGAKSYPSSHASSGIVLGHLLETVFPSRSTKIEAEAEQIGQNRLLGGVHHPSDVEAGRNLGEQIWDALQGCPQFKKDLAMAKAAL